MCTITRCAARLHTGLCADCTHLDVDLAGYIDFLRGSSSLDVDCVNFKPQAFDVSANLKMTRPAFGGYPMATIVRPPVPFGGGHRAAGRYEKAPLQPGGYGHLSNSAPHCGARR